MSKETKQSGTGRQAATTKVAKSIKQTSSPATRKILRDLFSQGNQR